MEKAIKFIGVAFGLGVMIYLIDKFAVKGSKDVHALEHADEPEKKGFLSFLRRLFHRKRGANVLTEEEKKAIKMEDKNYLQKLTEKQKSNARILVEEMKKAGITNPFSQAGILAVISKESQFNPQTENLNYTSEQLQKVFKLDVATADKIAHNPKLIARTVYAPEHNKTLGNRNADDAEKYIGRGYNQITGYPNYLKIGGKIGVDLVKNPEKLNDPKVAADAAIQFFKDGIAGLKSNGRLSDMYNNEGGINDFKNELDAVGAMYNINAGVGASLAHISEDVTGGRALALSRVGALTDFTKTV